MKGVLETTRAWLVVCHLPEAVNPGQFRPSVASQRPYLSVGEVVWLMPKTCFGLSRSGERKKSSAKGKFRKGSC